MDLGISGKRAVVAASTSGLGLASAISLGEAGCKVVVNGRTDDRLAAQPTGRVGDPTDFGEIVAFLCSQQANYITGVSVPIDGGRFTQLQ